MRLFFVLIFCCFGLLGGCKSTPSAPEPQPVDPQKLALEQASTPEALLCHHWITSIIWGPGSAATWSFRPTEARYVSGNSLEAVIDALDNQFDVIEIDVRLTRDDVWVIHHDGRTGRETGTIDNKRRKIESIRYEKEWGYLRQRDMQTGALTDTVPPNFRQLAQVFSRYAHSGQKLNIEIKSRAGSRDLEMLDYLAFSIIGQGRYFYSSLELENLKK